MRDPDQFSPEDFQRIVLGDGVIAGLEARGYSVKQASTIALWLRMSRFRAD